MNRYLNKRAKYNLVLLALNLIYVFIIGLFDPVINTRYVYATFSTLIYLVSVFATNTTNKIFFYFPIVVIIMNWISGLFNLPVLFQISSAVSTLFFLYIIVFLVFRIARSKEVGPLEFLESINVYLLLGIAGSVLFRAIYKADPMSFNLTVNHISSQAQFIYYSFVTMTTLGYGDITPVYPVAKSLSIFFSVAGQLYLTMIIAILVGKYLSRKSS